MINYEKIYHILEECCGATEDRREDFLSYMRNKDDYKEFRFEGWLGYGGKLYENSQGIYVDCYPEDRTPIRTFVIKTANERIYRLIGKMLG